MDEQQHDHPAQHRRRHDRQPTHDEVAGQRHDEQERYERPDEQRDAVEPDGDDGRVA